MSCNFQDINGLSNPITTVFESLLIFCIKTLSAGFQFRRFCLSNERLSFSNH